MKGMITAFMVLVGFHVISHASQLTVDVQLTGSGFPTAKVKASGCNNSTDRMIWRGKRCSDGQYLMEFEESVKEICTEKGGKMCLGLDFTDERCVIINGTIGDLSFQSSELNLDNVTFTDMDDLDYVSATTWSQQDNKSTLYIKPVKGAPVYRLFLKPIGERQNCTEEIIKAREKNGQVSFTALWDGKFVPGCEYMALISVEDECGSLLTLMRDVTDLILRYQPAAKLSTGNRRNAVDLVMLATILAVLAMLTTALVLLMLHLTQMRRPSAAQTPAPSTQEKAGVLSVPSRINILLVYSPRFRREMAALSSELKKLTGLQIEDLYDSGDEDKLTDPTVWLTRRLIDANTRFVLAASQKNDEHKESLREGGAFHHLLEHFLQHLQSSSLPYDYTRLHHVRFEGQEDTLLSDVTSGRLYQLPAHLPQLARNLAHTEVLGQATNDSEGAHS